jgi:hypothetical protein
MVKENKNSCRTGTGSEKLLFPLYLDDFVETHQVDDSTG